ncbi:hypothetical protein BDR07DRAFT_1485532 [Suillus spraguei]|nr:hypothetical protein BDR07DRAFT_1485532 [Suillus spraguei]
MPLELASHEAQQFNAPTPMTFRNIMPMHERHREEEQACYAGRLPIDLPGICKVFVYNPCRPPERHRGHLFPTGVIRATEDIMVTALLPSQRDLPLMSTPPSPITGPSVAGASSPANNSAHFHPYARQ